MADRHGSVRHAADRRSHIGVHKRSEGGGGGYYQLFHPNNGVMICDFGSSPRTADRHDIGCVRRALLPRLQYPSNETQQRFHRRKFVVSMLFRKSVAERLRIMLQSPDPTKVVVQYLPVTYTIRVIGNPTEPPPSLQTQAYAGLHFFNEMRWAKLSRR